jgi:hypothetical protein
MQKELEYQLSKALQKLETAQADLQKTQGYSQETERLQLLKELVKEQLQNEDTRHTAR